MNERSVTIAIDDQSLTFEVRGETEFGEPVVLLDQEDNLIRDARFADKGFTVERFLSGDQCEQLRSGLRRRLADILETDFDSTVALERYHALVDEAGHQDLVAQTQSGLPVEELPVDVSFIEQRVSEICGLPVSVTRPDTGTRKFNIRLVRPGAGDNNPPHRDVWIDHLKNAINLYFPLAGSTPLSSLPLLPGSHLWAESDIERTRAGALVDGIKYRVPAVVGCRHEYRLTRPPVGREQVLIFSPYLVHGGGANFNDDATRVSLEMRFWRAS